LLAHRWEVGKENKGRGYLNIKRLMLMFISSPMPTMVERIDDPP
jgi:hypothetical protein